MMKHECHNIPYRADFIVFLYFGIVFSGILLSSSYFLSETLLIMTPANVLLSIAQEAMAKQIIGSGEEIATATATATAVVRTVQSSIQFSDSLQYNNTELGFGLQYPSNAQIEEAGESVFFRLPDGLISVFIDRNIEQQQEQQQEQQPSQQLREYTNSILELLRQSYDGFTIERIGNFTLPKGYASNYIMFSFNNGTDDGLAFTTSTANMSDDENNIGYILLFTTPVSNSASFQDNIVDSIVSSFKINQEQTTTPSPPTPKEDQEEDEPVVRF
ncbi:MAG: hypothetical protein WAM26_16505 [Nitrososphaeraceae archaeon]